METAMNVLTFDVGLAAKLKRALARNGWDEDDINRLAESGELVGIRQVLHGHASITVISHVIDCDADQAPPPGGSIVVHQHGGLLQWDPSKVKLWFASEQKHGRWMESHKLSEAVENKSPLNANVLDYLIANPHLIPETWKKYKSIIFWGTVYRTDTNSVYVRYLHWTGHWASMNHYFSNSVPNGDPAALRVS